MRKNKTVRIAAFVGSACLTVGLLGAAASATGAYFQDNESGTISATLGSIDVRLDTVNLKFTELVPGATDTQDVNFKNVGKSVQDVYIRIDAAALQQIAGFATVKVNGVAVDASNATVKVANDLASGATKTAKITVTLSTSLTDEQVASVNIDDYNTLDFELIATQYNIGVDA